MQMNGDTTRDRLHMYIRFGFQRTSKRAIATSPPDDDGRSIPEGLPRIDGCLISNERMEGARRTRFRKNSVWVNRDAVFTAAHRIERDFFLENFNSRVDFN